MCKSEKTSFVTGAAATALLCVLAFSGVFANSVFVAGDVSGVWDADSVVVVDSVTVPPGDTLVIEPGVQVLFLDYFKFYILDGAVLHAVGTETDSIEFIPFLQGDRSLGLDFINASDESILEYCHINHALTSGVHLENSSITISHCLIENSKAPSGSIGGGAVEILSGSNCLIEYSTFQADTSVDLGGAIYCSQSSPIISNNLIQNNLAGYGVGSYGGGIAIEGHSNAEILNNTIRNNVVHATGLFSLGHAAGGAISCTDYSNAIISGNLILDNTVIVEIETTSDGGAIFIFDASPIISNNVIAGNQAQGNNGGAFHIYASQASITNNTIYNNTAGDSGGAIFAQFTTGLTITNCILYSNYANVGPEIYLKNTDMDVSYSDIQGSWPGEGNLDVDPIFRAGDVNDYHLQDSISCGDDGYSPLIDAGSPQYIDSLVDCDWGLGFAACDIGAFGGGAMVTAVDGGSPEIPADFLIVDNYPNPFNAATTIEYSLPEASNVKINVYDELGRSVKTLIESHQVAGRHSLIWNAAGLASGMYFYKIQAGDLAETRKMLLLK